MGSMAKTATRTSRSTFSTALRSAVLAQDGGTSRACSRISIPYSKSSSTALGGFWQSRETWRNPGQRQRRIFPSWALIHPPILNVYSDFTFHVLLLSGIFVAPGRGWLRARWSFGREQEKTWSNPKN